MKKRIVSFVLALVVLFGAALPTFAESETDWTLLYGCSDDTMTLVLLLPARFVRFAASVPLSLTFAEEDGEPVVLSGNALETYTVNETAAPQLVLKATFACDYMLRHFTVSVPENTALDSDGTGNEAVTLQDGGRLDEINAICYNRLKESTHSLWDSWNIAVGDTLTIQPYSPLPVALDIYLNNEKIGQLAPNAESLTIPVEREGDYCLEARCFGTTVWTEWFHAISSQEQYRSDLKDSVEFLFLGLPQLPIAMMTVPVLPLLTPVILPAAFVKGVAEVFKSLFAFVRITR